MVANGDGCVDSGRGPAAFYEWAKESGFLEFESVSVTKLETRVDVFFVSLFLFVLLRGEKTKSNGGRRHLCILTKQAGVYNRLACFYTSLVFLWLSESFEYCC
jgi:hypothetical protein